MSVRSSFLVILSEGACYGHQLRHEYERRTGRAVNVGQVYTTLERLERDKLVTREATDDYVRYAVTDTGRAEARAWLVEPAEPQPTDFAVKLALASSLASADAAAVIAAQRATVTAALERLRDEPGLLAAGTVAAAQAELAWLERCERELPSLVPVPLDAEPPRRGRPRGGASTTSV